MLALKGKSVWRIFLLGSLIATVADQICGRHEASQAPSSITVFLYPRGRRFPVRESRMFVQRFQFWQSVQRLLRYSSLDQSSWPDNQHWSAVMIEHGWILGFLSLFNLVASRVFCKALFNIVLIHINSTKAEKYYNLDTNSVLQERKKCSLELVHFTTFRH